MELESQADELREQGYGIAVISYDPQSATYRFSEDADLSFPLLSDVGSETIRRIVDLCEPDRDGKGAFRPRRTVERNHQPPVPHDISVILGRRN